MASKERYKRVEDIKEPSPKKGEVKIAVKYCGICGSDLHEYVAGPVLIPTKPHPLTGRDASEPITRSLSKKHVFS